MPFSDYKPYTKEEICKFLDFLFLKYFTNESMNRVRSIQAVYRDFDITPLTERMLESLENLEKKGKKTNDKS